MTSNNCISIPSETSYEPIYKKVFDPKLTKLSENFDVFQGIVTGNNEIFIKNEADLKTLNLERELLKPVLHGRDFNKWIIKNKNKKIIYVDKNIDMIKFFYTNEYLKQFKDVLLKRREVQNGVIPWWSLQWPREKIKLDKLPKILVQSTRNPRLSTRIVATMDTEGFYGSQGINFIISKYENESIYFLLGLLNSKLLNFIFKTKFLNVAIKADYLKDIMLPNSDKDIEYSVILKAKEILANSEQLFSEVNLSLELLKSEFKFISISKNLKLFYELSLSDFYKELEKNNVKLSLLQKEEIEKWFSVKSKNLIQLKNQITALEKEIDQIIYKLYGLAELEIILMEKDLVAEN